jgi:serine/threonine protein kinase
MNYNLVQTGGSSIVLGEGQYNKFILGKINKLLKITKVSEKYDEFKYLSTIREIKNYYNYYSIPDEISYLLKPTDNFYIHLQKLVQHEDLKIFGNPLKFFYIDNAGNKDLFDTIVDIDTNRDFSFWKSYNTILEFSKKIMEGLSFLHQKKICHLDIKPENIMVNTVTNQFRLIDFGFSSMEPFDNYVNNIKGTPGYFPTFINIKNITPWLPKIKAIDMDLVNGKVLFMENRKLVYKIDSYCFGRTLYYLKYIYKRQARYFCYNWEKGTSRKIDNIIASLLENDPIKRLTIDECLTKYF